MKSVLFVAVLLVAARLSAAFWLWDFITHSGRRQNLEIHGRFRCNNEILTEGTIELYDYKWGPIKDTFMGKFPIHGDGLVWFRGSTVEKVDTMPYLCVYHKCGVPSGQNCRILTTITINGGKRESMGRLQELQHFSVDNIDLANFKNYAGPEIGEDECISIFTPKMQCS